MTLKEPESMDECLYFTNRTLENGGKARAWVYKVDCPECGKAKMGKPVDSKTGKVKIRATEYVCPECGHTEEKAEHEEKLNVEIKYKCEQCGKEGETTTLYKRKSFCGTKAYVFTCNDCGHKMGLTKKMKKKKEKKKK